MKSYWLSSEKMTLRVSVTQDGPHAVIAEAAPIVRKFESQRLANLVAWMKKQGGFRMEELRGGDGH